MATSKIVIEAIIRLIHIFIRRTPNDVYPVTQLNHIFLLQHMDFVINHPIRITDVFAEMKLGLMAHYPYRKAHKF